MLKVFRTMSRRHCGFTIFFYAAILLVGNSALADVAIWTGGIGDWEESDRWRIDDTPPASNTIIPGTAFRDFWKVIIDDSEDDSVVSLDGTLPNGSPLLPRINELDIAEGDSLQVNSLLTLLTDKTDDGAGGIISNSGDLLIVENGILVVQGSNIPSPNGGILTLTGGGNVLLDGEPQSQFDPGARISGQGPLPRVFINENNVISGTGQLGLGEVVLVNRHIITANQAEKRLIIDPGGGSQLFPGVFTNDIGAQLSATAGGILELRGGDFLIDELSGIRADANSFVDLGTGANIIGGELVSAENGSFRVIGNASLSDVNLMGNIVVQDGTLTLSGTITNSNGTIALAGSGLTTMLIDGPVEIAGTGAITMTQSSKLHARQANSGAALRITAGVRIEGAGQIGERPLSIENDGTISANLQGQTLTIFSASGSILKNTRNMQATNSASLRLSGNLNLSGSGGKLQAFDDSRVELDGVRVAQQQLLTPENDTLNASARDIDFTKGAFITRGNSTIFDLREAAITNDGLLNIDGETTLTLLSKGVGEGQPAPSIANNATIFINAIDPNNTATLNVSGGDVRLTGGGRVVLSNNPNNNITQSVQEQATYALINVDNTIEGSGNIGGARLNLVNENDATVFADTEGELVIESPPAADAFNRGLMSTRDDATLIVRNSRLTNDAGGVIRAANFGTVRFEGGFLTNKGTVEAMGVVGVSATVEMQGSGVVNTGNIAATGGGIVQLRGALVSNASDGAVGTIAAGDASFVELSGGTSVNGGRLATSLNGRIRVVDTATLILPVTNAGFVEVLDGATVAVTGGIAATGKSFQSGALALANQGTITLNSTMSDSEIVILDRTLLNGGGEVIMSDDPGNTISGFVELPSAAFLFNVDNTIQGAGTIDSSVAFFNQSNGKIIGDGVNALKINAVGTSLLAIPFAAAITPPFNEGSIRAEGSGGIEIIQRAGNRDGATNAGRIEVEAGSSVQIFDTTNSFPFLNVGDIVIDGGANGGSMTVDFFQNGEAREFEEVFINGEFVTRVANSQRSGVITINGQFDGELRNFKGVVRGTGLLNGELVSARKFLPGNSPGAFNIVGRYVQLSGGELEIELAGMDAAAQYDQVVIDGEAVLDGTVVVIHLDGFTPEIGSDFDVVVATTLVDNGFAMAMLDGGLLQPSMVDIGDGTSALRLTGIEGVRFETASGSWDVGTNWTDDVLPDVNNTAWIVGNASTDTTVMGPDLNTNVLSLVVGSGDDAAAGITTLALANGVVTSTRGTTLRHDGQLRGNGTLGGDLYSAGAIAPDAIHIMGDYTQNETGTLAIELGGTTPSDEFDQLTVSGTAALDGILEVSLVDHGNGQFQPTGGDTFTVLSASDEVVGIFESINLPSLENALAWELEYLPNAVVIRTALAGDYNNSGSVEQGDLDLVLLTWGDRVAALPPPVAWNNQRPNNGVIGQAHLDAVLLNWGNTIGNDATAAAIPEPATWILVLLGAVIYAAGLAATR